MILKDIDMFYPASRQKWRAWLRKNHQVRQSVWVICYKKKTNIPSVTWSDAVDEALCFGWIDSLRRPLDEEKFIQYFAKRKPNGTWSKVNKKKVERLIEEKRMAPAGLSSIETAKQNGSWTILDQVEELIIPSELKRRLNKAPSAKKFFKSLSRSNKRIILQWITLAKREETRTNRINEVVRLAAMNLIPTQFRRK